MDIKLDKACRVRIKMPKLVSDCSYRGKKKSLRCDNGTCDGKQCKKYTPMKIDISHRHDLDVTFTHIEFDCGGEFGGVDDFNVEINDKINLEN